MPETVFVTGGTGFLGGAIIERLVAQGRPVKALTRSEDGAGKLRALGTSGLLGEGPGAGSGRALHVHPVRGSGEHDVEHPHPTG